jgi:hypothetical protein
MHSIYNYVPETNHIVRVHCVAAALFLQFVPHNVTSPIKCFVLCFCLHITEYEQMEGGGGGAQNFLGPRGVKYLNTSLAAATALHP